MTYKNFNISLDDWILNDVIGKTKNRSSRIKELILKGFFYEKDKETKLNNENNTSGLFCNFISNLNLNSIV